MNHRSEIAIAVFLAFLTASSAQAQTPAIGMPFETFRKALDNKISEDATDKSKADLDTISSCRNVKNIYTCSFHDKGFQSIVSNFKKMDLMNGRFELKLKLVVETTDGKVSKITLSGNRSDPVNLLQYYGTVVNIMQISDPQVVQGEGESKKLAEELGVMEGDDAQNIGKLHMTLKPYAQIDCLSQKSRVSMAVSCQFTPRT